MRLVGLLLVCLASTSAWSQVYRCTVDGRTVFSDRPCGDSAEEVTVRPAAGRVDDASVRAATERSQALVEQADMAVRRRQLTNEIQQRERDLDVAKHEMETELAVLRNKKSYAANNLAGATWEASISQEMQAVVNNYDRESSMLQAEIVRLRQQRDAL